MKVFIIFISLLSLKGFSFDESVLKEIQKINETKLRTCQSDGVSLKIKDGKIEVSDSKNKIGKNKVYNIYDESAKFILADHLTSTNLDYAKNNFTPELVIFKGKNKVLAIEGLSLKFQKNGVNENCKGSSINILHCYSKGSNVNVSTFKKKIVMSYKNKKIRDLASLGFIETSFPYDLYDFHSNIVKIGNNGSIKRSVALINGSDVVNFNYSYPNGKRVIENCNLSL